MCGARRLGPTQHRSGVRPFRLELSNALRYRGSGATVRWWPANEKSEVSGGPVSGTGWTCQAVGTAPTTLVTWTPTPGSEPWEVASPKAKTPPSEPMSQ